MIIEHSRITLIQGDIIAVPATGIQYGELAVVKSKRKSSLAQVIRLRGDEVFLQVFAGSRGVATGDQVRFLGHPMQVAFGDAMLGRVFNGSGDPIDGGPNLETLPRLEIGGPSVNPVKRIIPRGFIETRVPMIDVFNPLVESQKLPIFAAAGEPYNQLLSRIGMRADADVVILGGIGMKYDEYLKFRIAFEQAGVLPRTIMFIHTASDPVVERLLVPDMSLAVAEQFGVRGKRVLVLLTDMTAFADAMKEIAISMDQVPSNLGYPGSLYSDLAARYEKAVDFQDAGSITILAVTTMPGDDVTHPVPDNTGYITEGQFYLKNGVIEPFGSLSRLKQLVIGKVTREDHGYIMNSMIRLFAKSRDVEQKLSMGFEKTAEDERYLRYGQLFYERFMDLRVDIGINEALDLGWKTLKECFSADEVGIKQELIDQYWPGTSG
ncbi:MAG TPA: V-type ATP synthase subunit B [Syntrophorhabdus sp.]|jgi:V/A-type H+-transporting ATPase subunit B|nr:V-type ATP synthase subunit B [Syntrophorhabdus sp.]MDI9557351.1 V-type ATP synthase subunit B [Pseudomonadota bacterium]OPX97414.1 MAG: V-type sodium ATPase subunit B [Syntrophorhabdus sp. PtaB.Bin027]OQB76203.1 MAG: V-type sodium ATPase subunit B [Deltaproteobacteria bacterium ADurb.Bin135]MBP8745777.1 V-type ATP synthase subunit B [Syntrophorhabdus sp.]